MATYSVKEGMVHIQLPDCNSTDQLNKLIFPIEVYIKIFSLLDAKSLCRCSITCKNWYKLTNRVDVWQPVLDKGMYEWDSTSNKNCPQIIKIQSDIKLHPKELYSKCMPSIAYKNNAKSIYSYFAKFANSIKGFTPKCILFGSGLETTQFVKKWLFTEAMHIVNDQTANHSIYRTIGYTQGQSGVGAGIKLQVTYNDDVTANSTATINVVTLFNATWAERVAINEGKIKRINKLLQSPEMGSGPNNTPTTTTTTPTTTATTTTTSNSNNTPTTPTSPTTTEPGDEMSYEDSIKLNPKIGELCATLDVAMFAVNIATNKELWNVDKNELRAILNSANINAPLVVLALYIDPTAEFSLTTIDVVDMLELHNINRPWLVHKVCVSDLKGLLTALKWVFKELQINNS